MAGGSSKVLPGESILLPEQSYPWLVSLLQSCLGEFTLLPWQSTPMAGVDSYVQSNHLDAGVVDYIVVGSI